MQWLRPFTNIFEENLWHYFYYCLFGVREWCQTLTTTVCKTLNVFFQVLEDLVSVATRRTFMNKDILKWSNIFHMHVLAFFCNARGTPLDSNCFGMGTFGLLREYKKTVYGSFMNLGSGFFFFILVAQMWSKVMTAELYQCQRYQGILYLHEMKGVPVKTLRDRKRLPRVHLINCWGVKLFLLKLFKVLSEIDFLVLLHF